MKSCSELAQSAIETWSCEEIRCAVRADAHCPCFALISALSWEHAYYYGENTHILIRTG